MKKLSSLRITAGANLSILLTSCLVAVVAARLFDAMSRGQHAGAIVWTAMAAAIADFGLSQAAPFEGAQERHPHGTLIGTLLAMTLLIGGIVSIVGFGLAFLLPPQLSAVVGAALWMVPASVANTALINLLQGRGEMARFNLFRTLRPMVHLFPLFAAAGGLLHGVGSVLACTVVLEWCLLAGLLTNLAQSRRLSEWRFGKDVARDLVRFGLKAYPGNLSWLANSRLDQVLLSVLLPLNVLGTYAVAVSYSTVLYSIASSFGMSAYRRLARSKDLGETLAVAKKLLPAVLTLGICLAVAAPVAMPLLFGSKFASAVAPALWLLPASGVLAYNYLLSVSLRAGGEPGAVSCGEVFGLLVTVAGLLIFAAKGGIMAAVWVSLAGYLAVAITLTCLLARRIRAQAPDAATGNAPMAQAA